jgi:peroxiredoxin
VAVSSLMVPVGTPAPDFAISDLTGKVRRRDDFAAAPALLVAFLCNHCPYVRHVETQLGRLLTSFPELAVVGVCTNDAEAYPEDAPEHLARQATRAGWGFPYLVDEAQEVGRAYQAACTPDFFLYGADRRLAYRGAFDDSTLATDGRSPAICCAPRSSRRWPASACPSRTGRAWVAPSSGGSDRLRH